MIEGGSARPKKNCKFWSRNRRRLEEINVDRYDYIQIKVEISGSQLVSLGSRFKNNLFSEVEDYSSRDDESVPSF